MEVLEIVLMIVVGVAIMDGIGYLLSGTLPQYQGRSPQNCRCCGCRTTKAHCPNCGFGIRPSW